ncbi:MAG: tetratricopeptide repeat protein [Bacteroidota bacterium]
MTRRALLLTCAAVLLAGALLPGCARIFGSRYDNFRAYFNTVYNAREAFDAAEEQIIREDERIDRTRYLQVLPRPEEQRRSSGGGPFQEDVIERLGDLLRESPATKYTADALLLIGKSYYYQSNFEGAKLNLREAIRVAQEQDRSREEDEARLWLGRALAANGQSTEADEILRESIIRDGARPRWTSLMQLALAQLYVQDERWADAAAALVDGVARVDDGDIAARAQFLLGQVYEKLGRHAEAAEAYAEVRRYRPLYELRYAADLNRVLALGLEAGESARALDLVERMQRDDNNFDNLAELKVAEARVLTVSGRPAEAREVLVQLLYDEAGRDVGQMRGQALYRLGEVYRDGFEDFTLAAAYLDSAATSLRAPARRRSELTGQALLDIDEEAAVYTGFADAARRVADYDSLLVLGSLDDDAFRARIFEIQEARQLAAAEEAAEQERLRREQGFRAGGAGGTGTFGRAAAETDAVPTPGVTPRPGAAADVGFLSYRNPTRVQEALAAFQARWGERPLVPNWRRREAISLTIAEGTLDADLEVDSEAPGAAALGVDVTAVPRTADAQATMRAERAAALYEMGTALFLALGRPDSAAVVYRLVVDEGADATVAERAYYALAEVERALGNGPEAERWYRYVIDTYPDSALAEQARARLGLARVQPTEPVQNQAEEAYALAYATWQRGDYDEAFTDLLTVSERYPESDVAPRAMLAAGHVYAEWATTGSVDLFAPLPEADTLDLSGLYGQVAERFAGTPFARRAELMRTALEERRPVPDSLDLGLDELAPDSLALDSLTVPPLGDLDAEGNQEDADTTLDAASDGEPEAGTEVPAADEAAVPSPAITSDLGARTVERVLRSRARIVARPGTTTWIVATREQRGDAEALLSDLARRGYQSALLRDEREGEVRFLVAVGQFRQPQQAAAAEAVVRTLLEGEEALPYQIDLEGARIVLQGADLRTAPSGPLQFRPDRG